MCLTASCHRKKVWHRVCLLHLLCHERASINHFECASLGTFKKISLENNSFAILITNIADFNVHLQLKSSGMLGYSRWWLGRYNGPSSLIASFLLFPQRKKHKSTSIYELKEMLSAAHTVLVSLRPDLHSDIFVGQSDLLFMYMGVNLGFLSTCTVISWL